MVPSLASQNSGASPGGVGSRLQRETRSRHRGGRPVELDAYLLRALAHYD
jgi:hypothetical protein